jgi:hypothetical protein
LSPREEKGRQLLAELAEFLRAGKYAESVFDHLDALTQVIRAAEFRTQVDGSGEMTVPLDMLISLQPTPDGLAFGVPE